MSEYIQTHSDSGQSNVSPQTEAPISPLKLVVSNPPSLGGGFPGKTKETSAGFSAEICMRASTLYTLVAREPYHHLRCDLPLEIEEEWAGSSLDLVSVVCQFPPFDAENLSDFVEEDETLIGMILVRFQMKILKQLILFCLNHNATTLMIQVDENQSDYMGIFERFVTYEDRIPAKKGTLIQMTVPVNAEILHKCTDFIDEIYEKFLQTLWRHQRKNEIIRDYLKSIVNLGFRI